MPIQEKDLGKYKRPAIYIEESDNSIVDTPSQDELINLVPGFSKKGPYNKPVYVNNKVDFERIFGSIDKRLENKGSYFHRTALKMLETGPIWALNLLSTVPNRDTLNYVSMSTTSNYSSSDLTNPYSADYERFFNRQDFWERDEESFLDVVNDPTEDKERLLHLSNMGDKTITTFIFKSDTTGFDVDASSWYGGDDKVPSYIHPKSLISDYLVTVLIISGDWTNYKTLSVDTTWSNYFTQEGLLIENVSSFVNESNVTVLGSYDASLIPNFKDLDGVDMYIENLINNNTDKTSLFCAYNQDLLLENDYFSDLVDLIGNSIVGTDATEINFLSYKQQIKETVEYQNTSLDSPNNVFGQFGQSLRTNEWNNWTTSGIQWDSFNTTSLEASFVFSNAKYIINGVEYTPSVDTVKLNDVTSGYKRLDVLYLDNDGIQVMDGIEVDETEDSARTREITFENDNTIILGTIELGGSNNGVYTPVAVDTSGFIELDIVSSSDTGEGCIKVVFNNTAGSSLRNSEYDRLRSMKLFTEMSSMLQMNKGVIVTSNGAEKADIIDPVSITYTATSDAEIRIYLDGTLTNYINSGNILVYYIDNEFHISANTNEISTNLGEVDVVAKYSDFYLDSVNGVINNGDYFILDDEKVEMVMYLSEDKSLTVKFSKTIDGTGGISVVSDLGNWKQTVEIENLDEITDMTNTVSIKVNKDRYSELVRGMYLEAYYDEDYYSAPSGEGYVDGDNVPRKLTRIINIKNDSVDTDLKIIYTDAPIKITGIDGTDESYTTSYPAVYNYATTLKGAALKPFKIHKDSIPDGTEERLNDVLDVMSMNSSIYNGLVNKNKISWRYLVDSFGIGLQEQSKQQYVDLCGERLSCIGFINMPSAKQFKKSSNPSFTNDDGSLNIEYIKNGADETKNPDFLYSYGTGAGRSTVGYFFPYQKNTVDGITSFVPPAMFAATTYMKKHTSSSAGVYEWTIAAGVNHGRVPDTSGSEMDFTDTDLDNLALMGANPITYVRNVGYIINDESTAQVFPVSSLSYLHSRELLIELEDELYQMLLRYQWKWNTPAIRSEIKFRADKICQRYVDTNGLYNYRNVIDTSNNTNYIIDLQGGVLDTHVEITKGMGWIVNNIVVEKTGAINSTGFQQ